MKGLKKKILKLSACILTALFGFSLFSAGTIYENRGYAEESSGETTEKYVFDECNETSPFTAIPYARNARSARTERTRNPRR